MAFTKDMTIAEILRTNPKTAGFLCLMVCTA